VGKANDVRAGVEGSRLPRDVKLTTAASNALAQDITVPGIVEATSYDGNTALSGMVARGTGRAAAEAAVAGLPTSATSSTTFTRQGHGPVSGSAHQRATRRASRGGNHAGPDGRPGAR
jgi:hypothetical protein